MTLRKALSQVPDPRAPNRQYPLWGLLALILVAFLSCVDSLPAPNPTPVQGPRPHRPDHPFFPA